MKISSLKISNFKAIRKLQMDQLSDVVIVAGPNGSGKSCILDAIRFLKSTYAGYRQQNEWQHFFNEFQLNMQNADEVRRVFFDPTSPIDIEAKFEISLAEKRYIKANAERLLNKRLWDQQFREGRQFPPQGNRRQAQLTKSDREKFIGQALDEILSSLESPTQIASLRFTNTSNIDTKPNTLLAFIFSIYDPTNIGIIDYHSANRSYQREKVGGINVNIEETADRLAQHALYNWQGKYSNIKSELAAAYIRDIFVQKAGGDTAVTPSILKTLEELFSTFLPGKKFSGPVPGKAGQLTFPVKLNSGAEHDIDDLSSGEKELVYGYLRLRNVSPTNSIILLDEPELHLNPRLVLGLPSFYRKHLGLDLNNQLWMTTHSDAFLREAYKNGGISVFHISPADSVKPNENQCVAISASDAINRAVVDLVGDIAGFRPGNKIVIFESSDNASFDAAMTKRLFPEFAERINTLSGDNKFGVRQLYVALNKAASQMKLDSQIYAISDRDSKSDERSDLARSFEWDVYHIENYLLNEEFIQKVISDYPSFSRGMTKTEISKALLRCARSALSGLVEHQMRQEINSTIRKSIDLGYDVRNLGPVDGFSESISRTAVKMDSISKITFAPPKLRQLHKSIEGELKTALRSKRWKVEFRGRDVLRRFAGEYLNGLPYEAFRDAIIARMGDAGFRPLGMTKIINKILSE